MSNPKQDYDTSRAGRHPYRNDPRRWLVQFRERQVVVFPIWNRKDGARTGTRRVASWTPWKTSKRFMTEAESIEYFEHVRRSGLAAWRITYGGKVVKR